MGFTSIFIFVAQLLVVYSQTNLQRLPENVRPESYVLTLNTDLGTMEFNGTLSIRLNVVTSTNSVILHSKDLIIEALTLSMMGTNVNLTYNFTTTADLLNIYTQQPLFGTNIQLNIRYRGALGSGNVGYYRAFYLDASNRNISMAVTHLEATNARRAFPCFDQPNFKAKFQITLLRKQHQVTSSNMPLLNTTTDNKGQIMDFYETSVTMPTYLVAFMVSEYGSISVTHDSKTYRTFARPELLLRGDASYSLEVAPLAISEMETFTLFPYPISKMDQVPVPNAHYKIGAMENYGMVTYRERMLMYNSELSTAQEKQSIATIIVHEFAHQWFGDLVTPEWWNYIWLNEGFATYFEQYITSRIETSWDLMEQFITTNIQPAFNDDALETSRPMSRNVETPNEIDGIYDTIVYEKAGSVIRMAEWFLGSTVLRAGLQDYLNEWQYGNVNPSKLYQKWEKAFNRTTLNTTAVLHVWETQAGYPVVNVTRNYNSNSNSVALNQERFYINRLTGSDTTRWTIPFDYFTRTSSGSEIAWLSAAASSITIRLDVNEWVIFNKNVKGFYRVNYDETNWKLITSYLKTGAISTIPVENRAQLIDDAFNLARSGRLKYSLALELGTYVANETHYVPIYTFNNVMNFLDRLSTGQSHHDDLKEYAIDILKPIYSRLGFTITSSDSHLNKLTKVNVNTWLCRHGHQTCIDESYKLLSSWLNNNSSIQPDMQSYVYCYGMKNATQTQHDYASTKYYNSREDTQRARIATGLGCAGNTAILTNLLQNLIRTDTLTQTDKLNAITSTYTNNGAQGVNLVLDFLRTNFKDVNEKIGSIGRIISGVASRITTDEQYSKFQTFANQNSASMTQSVKDVVEAANVTANNNLVWISNNKDDLTLYLKGGSATTFASILVTLICTFIHYV